VLLLSYSYSFYKAWETILNDSPSCDTNSRHFHELSLQRCTSYDPNDLHHFEITTMILVHLSNTYYGAGQDELHFSIALPHSLGQTTNFSKALFISRQQSKHDSNGCVFNDERNTLWDVGPRLKEEQHHLTWNVLLTTHHENDPEDGAKDSDWPCEEPKQDDPK